MKKLYQKTGSTGDNAKDLTEVGVILTEDEYTDLLDGTFSGRYDDLANKPNLATIATTGSYTDLTNKPIIGSANLTVYQNSTRKGTFSANATTGKTMTIYVPKLNGNETTNSTTSFYAPTSAGTSGYFLKSNGSGAPTWSTGDEMFLSRNRATTSDNLNRLYKQGSFVTVPETWNGSTTSWASCPSSQPYGTLINYYTPDSTGVKTGAQIYFPSERSEVYFRNIFNNQNTNLGSWQPLTVGLKSVQSGTFSDSSVTIAGSGTKDFTVTFPKSFKVAPRVAISCKQGKCVVKFNNSSTTYFSVTIFNLNTWNMGGMEFDWVAFEG